MAETNTPRLGIRQWSAGTDSPSRQEFNDSFAQLETKVLIGAQGIASARPAPASANARSLYFATDTEEVWWSTGTTWRSLGRITSDGVVVSSTAAKIAQVVKASSGQTASIFEVQSSGGAVLARFAADGSFAMGGVHVPVKAGGGVVTGMTTDAAHNVKTHSADQVGQKVKGEAGQNADLSQWIDGAGAVVAKVDRLGTPTFPSVRVTAAPASGDQLANRDYVDGKAPAVHTHTSTQITDSTTTGRSLLTATSAAAAKGVVGLDNVDNTSDVNKPVSTPQQTALDGKAPTTHTHTASQVSDSTATGRSLLTAASVAAVKTTLALNNVDNTSDANKPVSSAQQTALDGKANTSHSHTTSQISDFAAGIAAIPVSNLAPATSTVNLGGNRIISAGYPVSGSDVAVKNYVDSVVSIKANRGLRGEGFVTLAGGITYVDHTFSISSRLTPGSPQWEAFDWNDYDIIPGLIVNSIYPYSINIQNVSEKTFTMRVYRPANANQSTSATMDFYWKAFSKTTG